MRGRVEKDTTLLGGASVAGWAGLEGLRFLGYKFVGQAPIVLAIGGRFKCFYGLL